MAKILVTGGTGFIGSHVVERLLSEGHRALVLDRSAPGLLVERPEHEVDIFWGDVKSATDVTEAAAHADGIIHLAAVLGTQETIANPRPAVETNITGALNVFEAAAQYDLPVVYAGVGNHWMREHGAGTYTITKTAVEDFAKMFNAFRGGRISVVRPVNAYGRGQGPSLPYGPSKVRKIMPAFICRALAGQPIEVYGDGTQVSDCVHVTDVADIFVRAMRWTSRNGPAPRPFEVGPAQSVDVNHIAATVAAEVSALTGQEPVEVVHLPMRPGEVPNAVVRASEETLEPLGIRAAAFLPLEVGIRDTVQWLVTHWWPTWKEQSA